MLADKFKNPKVQYLSRAGSRTLVHQPPTGERGQNNDASVIKDNGLDSRLQRHLMSSNSLDTNSSSFLGRTINTLLTNEEDLCRFIWTRSVLQDSDGQPLSTQVFFLKKRSHSLSELGGCAAFRRCPRQIRSGCYLHDRSESL